MTRPLHLLEVGVRWPPETFVRRKLELLAAAGVRVTVASPLLPGAPRPAVPGVELLPIHHWRAPRWRKLMDVMVGLFGLLLRHPRRFRRLLSTVRGPLAPARRSGFWWRVGLLRRYLQLAGLSPDVVQFEWETAAVEHLPLTEVWDCPVLMSCRGVAITLYPTTQARDWVDLLPQAFRRVAAVHCVSEATVHEAVAQGLDPAKARVIRTSVDAAQFRPSEGRARSANELRVVSIATLRWPKGPEYAVQAVAEARRLGVPARLELVGPEPVEELAEPSERERVLYTAADLGLDGAVRVAGQSDHRDIRARLLAADVLLHCSLLEGIPNVVLEAMACGIPVVVTDCGGVREAVDDGVEGFVVQPRDVPAMARALEHLWRRPELREAMGAAGRRRATTGFGEAVQLEGFLSMLGEVVPG